MTRPRFDLFAISGLVLFLELACIRWFPAHVLFLSFFTNTVLLACFVGMSIGCLTARQPGNRIRWTPMWLLLAIVAGLLIENYHGKLERHLDVGNQSNPEVVFFGTETNSLKPVEFAVPIEMMAGAFYLLVALVMVGPGQELGRAFNRVTDRSTAYALNLLGSLAGIGLFAVSSKLFLPPIAWFAMVAVGLGYFLWSVPQGRLGRPGMIGTLAVMLGLTGITSGILVRDGVAIWSPYYRIQLSYRDYIINTNMISHQVMSSREGASAVAYTLPYLFARDTGRVPYKRVLIIGAGSGNDLSRALDWTPPDAQIDAVEIDPIIRNLGMRFHPDQPYADKRVTSHLTDGRTFLRQAPAGEYDLVVFALVDSLVLHSGASNIRLESYLFTQEAINDVARVLKPEGTFAVYNFFRQGWIVARLRDSLKQAFGADPVVLTDPPSDAVTLNRFDNAFTAAFAGRPQAVEPLRKKFAENGNSYWVPGDRPVDHSTPCRFGADRPPPLPAELPAEVGTISRPDWVRLRAATVEASSDLPAATDDWPFLYVRRPTIPSATWRGTVLVAFLSVLLWFVLRSPRSSEPTSEKSEPLNKGLIARSFLLGAGFMLIETKAVVQMALLFGSTWVVNTVVFTAVLVMSLLGNRWATWRKPQSLWPYYVGLFVTLGVNMVVPLETLMSLPEPVSMLAACLLTFAPIAFAGVVFAVSFERSNHPDQMFGANVAGALVGGIAENLSLLLGFKGLLLVAGGFYLLSSWLGSRKSSLSDQAGAYNSDGLIDARLRDSATNSWLAERLRHPSSSSRPPTILPAE